MINHLKKNKYEYISVLTIILMTTFFLRWLLQLELANFSIPFVYEGGDDISLLVNSKMMSEQFWCLSSNRLGAPFGADFYAFTVNVMHNFDLFTLKIFAVVTGDYVAASNIEYISAFYFVALMSYFVMRKLHISHWISVSSSIVYAFVPYLFMRSMSHIVLTTCYFVPLAFLICIWLYEEDNYLKFNKNFFKNSKNWMTLIFVILIANNGIAYYPFFACYMMLVVGLSHSIKNKSVRKLIDSMKLVGATLVFLLLNTVPILIHNLKTGATTLETGRNIGESEIYGLKVIQLLLPINGHDIDLLSRGISKYNSSTPFLNIENMSAYMGLMGVLGFVFLIVFLFYKVRTEFEARLRLMAELNLFLVFLGTVGGLGVMFSLVISDQLRSYARISIFITFGAILTYSLLLNMIYQKAGRKSWIAVIGIIFALVCVKEEFPGDYFIPRYKTNEINFNSDEKLVADLETRVNANAMIYQLPYHQYPEAGNDDNMRDYHLFTGYLHSDTLRWSYASLKGTSNDQWNEDISKLDLKSMVKQLNENGFSAIYVDRRAYTTAELAKMDEGMENITGNKVVISDNSNLSYIIINNK